MTLSPEMKPLLILARRLGHITMALSLGYLCLLCLGVALALAMPHGPGDDLLQEVEAHGWNFIPLLLTLAGMLRVCTWMIGKLPPEGGASQ